MDVLNVKHQICPNLWKNETLCDDCDLKLIEGVTFEAPPSKPSWTLSTYLTLERFPKSIFGKLLIVLNGITMETGFLCIELQLKH